MAINAVDYPSTLPCPRTWSEEEVENLIRSNSEVGIIKARKRFTRKLMKVTWTMIMEKSQYDEWVKFDDLTGGGLVAFNFKHPYTRKVSKYKMTAKPKVVPDFKVFTVSIEMQEVIA